MAFRAPDKPITLDIVRQHIPANANVRGMFFNFAVNAVQSLATKPLKIKTYVPFKAYPMVDYVELLDRCAADVLPDLDRSSAYHRIGVAVYPAFAKTLVGSTIFAVAGRDFQRTMELAPKAYQVSVEPGSVDVVTHAPGHATVRLRNLWTFVDSLQVGVWEGTLAACNAVGEVYAKTLSPCDADLEIRWH